MAVATTRVTKDSPRLSHRPVRVHPRACGGNSLFRGITRRRLHRAGPSPRVRGKRPDVNGSPRTTTVHPRACGGNPMLIFASACGAGSIPAVRGKQGVPQLLAVHPRACGGNSISSFLEATVGSIPARAGDNVVQPSADYKQGPSPRVRGKLRCRRGRQHGSGSIPARAGETGPVTAWRKIARVHPRACGGNHRGRPVGDRDPGPSPRVRGKPYVPHRQPFEAGSIPARAGET